MTDTQPARRRLLIVDLGAAVRLARGRVGLTQLGLAELAGVAQSTVAEIEGNVVQSRRVTVDAVLGALQTAHGAPWQVTHVYCPRCHAAPGDSCDPRTLGRHRYHLDRLTALAEARLAYLEHLLRREGTPGGTA